jgi:hypothetical protein
MDQKFLFSALGMNVKQFLDKHSFPSIDSSIFSSEHCSEIRSHLYGMPKKDEDLKDKVVSLLLKGEIEEVRDKEGISIFLIQIKYKAEYYLVELKLKNYQWMFSSIHFVGEVAKTGKKWFIGAFLLLLLFLIIPVVFAKPLFNLMDDYQSPKTNDGVTFEDPTQKESVPQPMTSPDNKEFASLSIEQVQLIAESLDYKLISSAELQQMHEEIRQIEINSKTIEDKKMESHPSSSPINNVEVTITPGMQSDDIATLLFEKGLARNEHEIKQLFSELNLNKRLRAGSYNIPSNSTYLDIIRLITSK